MNLPGLAAAYPARRSPDVDAARRHTARWAGETGLLDSGDPWWEIWDAQDLADFDFALFAGLVHPDARGDRLDLMADWYLWGWYLDDLVMERFQRTRDRTGAGVLLSRMAGVLDPDNATEPTNPAERGLADLWRRTTAGRSAPWRAQFGASIPNLFEDALWEIDNLVQGRIPEPVDYLSMRRMAGGACWAARLVEFLLGLDLPPRWRRSTTVRRLHDAFADTVDLHNDLVSLRREVEYEQEVNNAVVVAGAFLPDPGNGQAAARTLQLLLARLELFEQLASTDVPRLSRELDRDGRIAAGSARYLDGLRDWLAGDFQWHRETHRYTEPSWRRKQTDAPATVPLGPSGLGTAAARITGWHPASGPWQGARQTAPARTLRG